MLTANSQQSTVNSQQSTLNTQQSTLNSQQSAATLHPNLAEVSNHQETARAISLQLTPQWLHLSSNKD
ncbi:hypothetical protein IQ252_12185 [Tychonema sp. LEGE 07203]|nr:hypothetical protein [Tychonema sp. LEGE 07203]